MPFCPECKCEYRPGFDKCADCGVWLVDSLEQAERRTDEAQDRQERSSRPMPQYSQEIQMIMNSLPSGPSLPKGPVAPTRSSRSEPSYEPDPEDAIVKKFNEYDSWIEIAHIPSEEMSQMLSNGLESAQVPHIIIPGTHGGKFWGGYGGGIYETDGADILLVPEQFVDQADEVGVALMGEIYEQFKTPNS